MSIETIAIVIFIFHSPLYCAILAAANKRSILKWLVAGLFGYFIATAVITYQVIKEKKFSDASKKTGVLATASFTGAFVLFLAVASATASLLPDTADGTQSTASLLPDTTDGTQSKSTSGETSNSKLLMPNLAGMTIGAAKETLSAVDDELYLDDVDLLGFRSVWNYENWTVMSQNPPAGTQITKGMRLCAGVVKNDETWRTLNFVKCWQDASDEMDAQMATVDLRSNTGLADATFINEGPLPAQYRANVDIDDDNGRSYLLTFCTNSPVAPGASPKYLELYIDNSTAGDKYFATLFDELTGKFQFKWTKLEKNYGSLGCNSY